MDASGYVAPCVRILKENFRVSFLCVYTLRGQTFACSLVIDQNLTLSRQLLLYVKLTRLRVLLGDPLFQTLQNLTFGSSSPGSTRFGSVVVVSSRSNSPPAVRYCINIALTLATRISIIIDVASVAPLPRNYPFCHAHLSRPSPPSLSATIRAIVLQ